MLIDVHCHLSSKEGEKIRKKYENILIVDCALNLEELKISFELQKFGNIFTSAGLYPIDALKLSQREIENYIEFIKENKDKIIAIGEIGLDNYLIKESEKRKIAKDVFEYLLEFSKEIKKPVILHARDSHKDVLKVLLDHDIKNAIFHYFDGDLKIAKEIISNNYLISINNAIKYKNHLKNIAKEIDLDYLITETDAPWPLNKFNEPSKVIEAVEEIAKLKNLDIKEVENKIYNNFLKYFKLNNSSDSAKI